MWITTNSVINQYGLKPKQFNLDKDDTSGLEEIVEDWITQAESLIETYCHRKFEGDQVTPALQNICNRLVGNMHVLAVSRRDTPIIKVNDWTVKSVPSVVFTDDIKSDLAPFVKDSSNDYKKVGFFAITGDDSGEC